MVSIGLTYWVWEHRILKEEEEEKKTVELVQ